MYSICKLTHPATGVEHALTCHFFSRTEKSLIVAGANIIRVYRLIPDVDPACKKDVYTGIVNFLRNLDILIIDTEFSLFCFCLYTCPGVRCIVGIYSHNSIN
jgi:hypothetical protein